MPPWAEWQAAVEPEIISGLHLRSHTQEHTTLYLYLFSILVFFLVMVSVFVIMPSWYLCSHTEAHNKHNFNLDICILIMTVF